jgi:NAD(P)-dependent dehydrogenase (short-subunit alcohol dehydrogenase family)
MHVLFIGGTGNISAACSRLCVERGMEVFVLDRGRREMPAAGVHSLVAEVNDRAQDPGVVRGGPQAAACRRRDQPDHGPLHRGMAQGERRIARQTRRPS